MLFSCLVEKLCLQGHLPFFDKTFRQEGQTFKILLFKKNHLFSYNYQKIGAILSFVFPTELKLRNK